MRHFVVTAALAISVLSLPCAAEPYNSHLLGQLAQQIRSVRALAPASTKRFSCLSNLKGLTSIPMDVTKASLGAPDRVGELDADDKYPHLIVWAYELGKYQAPAPPKSNTNLNEIVVSNGVDYPEVVFFFGDDMLAREVVCGNFPK